jgi:chromosome segregation ATPase
MTTEKSEFDQLKDYVGQLTIRQENCISAMEKFSTTVLQRLATLEQNVGASSPPPSQEGDIDLRKEIFFLKKERDELKMQLDEANREDQRNRRAIDDYMAKSKAKIAELKAALAEAQRQSPADSRQMDKNNNVEGAKGSVTKSLATKSQKDEQNVARHQVAARFQALRSKQRAAKKVDVDSDDDQR